MNINETELFDPTIKSNIVKSAVFMTKDRSHPYAVRISNAYIGADRVVMATTMWELESLVAIEERNQRGQELRKHIVEISGGDEIAATEMMTEKVEKINSELMSLISHTLKIDDRLDWDKKIITESYEEFLYPFPPQKKQPSEEEGGLMKIFSFKSAEERAEEAFKAQMDKYILEKRDAIRKYMIEREKFNLRKRRNNAEIKRLRKCFENGEKSAVEKYSKIILANSVYPENFKPENEITYNPYTKALTLNLLFCGYENFPDIMKYKCVIENKSVTEVKFSPEEKYRRYEKALLSAGLRSIHELFEALYGGFVEEIILNAFVPSNNKEIENMTAKFASGVSRCVYAVSVKKSDFENKEISDENYLDVLESFGMKRVKDRFINETEIIKPIYTKEK